MLTFSHLTQQAQHVQDIQDVQQRSASVNIEVTARDHGVSERMKSYGSDKASKLVRYFDRISRIHVVLETVHDTRRVEMVVHVDSGATLVGHERNADMFAAI